MHLQKKFLMIKIENLFQKFFIKIFRLLPCCNTRFIRIQFPPSGGIGCMDLIDEHKLS